MTRSIAFVAALALAAAAAAGDDPKVVERAVSLEPAPTAALVGATVFDGTGSAPIRDAVVLLERDRVARVGTRREVPVPPGARVIDVAGKHIVPGLIDAHIHFFQSGGLYTRPDIVDLRRFRPYDDEVAAIKANLDDTFRRYLVSGVTAVVDMGGPMWNFAVRDRARRSLAAPRVAVAGPLISTVSRPQLDLGDPPIIRAGSADEARALVEAQLPSRPDLIKIWFVVTDQRPMAEMVAVARAVIERAHAAGVRVAVHATELESAREVVDLGADILVHSVHDREVDDAFIALLRERGVILIPTLVVNRGYSQVLGGQPVIGRFAEKYGTPAVIATWAEMTKVADPGTSSGLAERLKRTAERERVMAANLTRLHLAGVRIAAGTDAGNIGTLPGASLHEELEAMAAAGMSPEAVLLAATREAARVFAAEPEVGTLAPGKLADLLVLDGDPLADLAALERIDRVVKGGVVLTPAELLPPNPAWVVERQVEAYNDHDLDRFLAFYGADAVIADHLSGEVRMAGLEAMRSAYDKLFMANPELRCTVLDRVVAGDMVIDHELVTGIDGRPYFHGVALYQVAGGLIRKVWFLPRS